MKFETKHQIISVEDGYLALEFLKKVIKENLIKKVENIDEVFETINVSLGIGDDAISKLDNLHLQ